MQQVSKKIPIFAPSEVFGTIPEIVLKLAQSANITEKIDKTKKFLNKNIYMATKRTTIQLPRGAARKICRAEGCGKTTLYAALNYTSHSDEAKRLRKLAVTMYGGVEYKKPIL